MVRMVRTAEMTDEEKAQPQHVAVRNAKERAKGDGPRNVVDPDMVIKSLDHLLRVWELNRQYRLRNIAGSREDRLRGLFGSGR